MNRNKLIKALVSQFEEQISKLPDQKLEELESGKLEVSLTQTVGNEAGGMAGPGRRQIDPGSPSKITQRGPAPAPSPIVRAGGKSRPF
ncbi:MULTISPECIES: hypothetical protein [Legionella]|uniref:Uncharacterized protein n=1 Tax=Legionella maceachernii TaxID=466 RepID=A0A0W0W0R4_9GAMM|nr:hypothetical protein [Legionella maceachernii]KTD25928.1 hypothetical protein Lmac_1699 [Legionella maceachernii]SJZ48668.1 hypothetical protein SAMN02745128_00206 [Legionella maceachernii]SUP03828.1 Uncharacterised protein [Legionella maceachernii]